MQRRSRGKRVYRRKDRDLEERLDRLETRIEKLEQAARSDRSGDGGTAECSCCDDLIGCLDDSVTDVRELRKRVRDARS